MPRSPILGSAMSGVNGTPVYGPSTIGMVLNAASGHVYRPYTPTLPWTIACVAVPFASSIPIAMSDVGAASAVVNLLAFASTGFIRHDYRTHAAGNYTALDSGIPWTAGKSYAIAVSRDTTYANGGISYFGVNGRGASAVTSGASVSTPTWDTFHIGGYYATSAWINSNVSTSLVLFWDRAFNAEELAAWSRDPWQIFKPQQIIIPTPAAAGYTHPTLSAATALEIGATSFKPSVTYTFA